MINTKNQQEALDYRGGNLLIMLIYGKEATTQIENSVPYYSVSKWSSNTKMLLLHFHAP
mgnify:CR=1 FL=1